ncbi:MAG: HAMP domain-containing sensor histidine kinase [Comamonadaceae bacterium]|nr:MAG: HAMP domain-containing sensor histidine kinase [Comamonadaceae bacterium]
MNIALRYRNWSLRTKFAVLLIAASLVPSALTAWISLREMQAARVQDTQRSLVARAEQLSHELDSINAGYLASLQRVAYQPAVNAFCLAGDTSRQASRSQVRGMFDAFPKSDGNVRAMALFNHQGIVEVSTDDDIVGQDFSRRHSVKTALLGRKMVSDIYVSTSGESAVPTVGYLVPVLGPRAEVACVLALWLRADVVWDVLKAANGKVGPESFAALYDRYGIRIGHSFRQDMVFRPAGELNRELVDELVATSRFGTDTQVLLGDVRDFPEQFQLARIDSPTAAVFHGYSPANRTWNYGVASRMASVPWTVFYLTPEAPLQLEFAKLARKNVLLFLAIIAGAIAAGAAFATTIVRPIIALRQATRAVAKGDAGVRVPIRRRDELGHLAENFNDMTEKIQLQAGHIRASHDELRKYADDLEVANKDLDAFTFSVSHDLRSPLAVVNGFSTLLGKRLTDSADDKAMHYLTRIRNSTMVMEELIDGLLRLSRIGRQPLQMQEVNIREVIEDVADELRQLGALDHAFVIELAAGEEIAWADKVLIRQVFANLLSNAAKFSAKADNPAITVTSGEKDGMQVYSVRDNGPGFAPEKADLLFQPFKRLHTAEEFAGVGLGLSIVERIVHKHGGKVWASAGIGRGAVFRFTLERRDAGPPAA